jgi:hypothetical protein
MEGSRVLLLRRSLLFFMLLLPAIPYPSRLIYIPYSLSKTLPMLARLRPVVSRSKMDNTICDALLQAFSCEVLRTSLHQAWVGWIDRDLLQHTNRSTPLLVSTIGFGLWQVKVTDMR